uniref:RAD9-HUS1-RAD1 interacting nuclear orphan 1 n=1 Tax=Lepisosteus oculatus TaxID=7918 RepID=W5NII5_LEPOC
MPRKGKNSYTQLKKPPLLFQERPIDGAKHQYGTPIKSAVNPLRVVAQPCEQNTTSEQWVMKPYFDTTMQLHFPARRRKRQQSGSFTHQRSVLGRSSLVRAKKTSVCKFPSLTFECSFEAPCQPQQPLLAVSAGKGSCQTGLPEKNEALEVNRGFESLNGVQKNPRKLSSDVCEVRRTPVPEMERDLEGTPRACRDSDMESASTPPSLHTPGADSGGRRSCESQNFASDLAGRLIFFAPTPTDTESQAETLVKDTPEQDYGVKVTWRKRKGIMRFLQDQGKLTSKEALVSS